MEFTRGRTLPLYEGSPPGTEEWHHRELEYYSELYRTEVVTNVVVPTLTPVLPARGCGSAVVVAPGGGFHSLSINREGFDVAEWLAARGVAAFVLKYRLVPSGDDAVMEFVSKPREAAAADMSAVAPLAAADGARAVGLVRERASEWEVDPNRVGFIGFSAGGDVLLRVAFGADDALRPDFFAAIYAPLRGIDVRQVPAGIGPLFIVVALDDQIGLAEDALELCQRWRAAGRPTELHLYERGGHGFGMGKQGLPSDTWIDRFGDWLVADALMPPSP